MISRDDINAIAALLENFAHRVQPAAPVDQVAGADVVIGLHCHQPVERLRIAVDIGENEQLHEFILCVDCMISAGPDFGYTVFACASFAPQSLRCSSSRLQLTPLRLVSIFPLPWIGRLSAGGSHSWRNPVITPTGAFAKSPIARRWFD